MGDLLDVFLEQAERVRVGEHQARHLLVKQFAKSLNVYEAPGVGRNRHGFQARETNAGWIGPVSRVRDQHLPSRQPLAFVMGAHDQQSGHLTARPSRRLKCGSRHARKRAQSLLQPPEQLEHPLSALIGLQRVQPREAGHGGGHLGHLGVVLHRAGTQRVETRVHAVVLLGQAGVVGDQVPLGDLWEARRDGSLQALWHLDRLHVERGEVEGSPPLPGGVHDGARPRGPLAAHRGALGHGSTSLMARANASICSLVRRSVTATSSTCSS